VPIDRAEAFVAKEGSRATRELAMPEDLIKNLNKLSPAIMGTVQGFHSVPEISRISEVSIEMKTSAYITVNEAFVVLRE